VSVGTGGAVRSSPRCAPAPRLVRGALGQRIRNQLRNVPEIQFFLDDSLEYVEQIDRALRSDQ